MSTRDLTAPPLSRTAMDGALPYARIALGVAFVAYSAYATVFLCAADLMPLAGERRSFVIPDRFWFGLLAAAVIFAGEVFTAERWLRLYLVFLVPDVLYTARQTVPGAGRLLDVYLDAPPETVVILAWIASIIVGVIVAWYGERLLLGPRRNLKGARYAPDKPATG